MGDVRFLHAYEQVRDATDRARQLRALSDEQVIGALAAASREMDPFMANVLATEAMNRARRASVIAVSIAEGVLVLDAGGRISYANPMTERLLQRRRDELVGRALNEALRPMREAGEAFDLDGDVACMLTRTQPAREREDLCFTRGDGTSIAVSCTTSVVVRHDEVTGVVVAFRDIAERKTAEAELREAWRHYRLLADNSSDMVTLSTPLGYTTYVSPACRRILGREPEELMKLRWMALIHPDDMAQITPEIGNAPRADATLTINYRMRHADGDYRWLETTARRVDDPDTPEGERVLSVTRDVTARKMEEEARRAAERAHRLVIENVTDVIALLDEDGRVVFASSAAPTVLRQDVEKLMHNPIWRAVHPDDRDRLRRLHATLRPGWRGTLTATLRAPARDPGGEREPSDDTPGARGHAARRMRESWLDVTLRHLQEGAGEEGPRMLCHLRDVTPRVLAEGALRRSEARYRALAEHAADLLWTLHRNGQITYVCQRAQETLGHPAERLLGSPAYDLVHPDDAPRLRRAADELLAGPLSHRLTLRMRRADRSYVTLDVSVRAIRAGSAQPEEVLLVGCALPQLPSDAVGEGARPRGSA